MQSLIKDINLAAEGRKKIDWVSNFMPTLNTLGDRFEKEQTFKGQTIVVSVHLEAKTAYLATVLKRVVLMSSLQVQTLFLHKMM